MPEHRTGTPSALSDLESFLWHDFELGLTDWTAWVQRKTPDLSGTVTPESFLHAMRLHRALRTLQATNSGLGGEEHAALETINQLITAFQIRPQLRLDRTLPLVSTGSPGPGAHLLTTALETLRSGEWRRFKLCRDPSCRASYYDASKAAVKTWCSMGTCGSRNKMRRYRERR